MSPGFPFPSPLILGHRGASACAPENTLAAFRLAMEMGADGIELDAQLTLDGAVMVLHDPNVARVSNGQGAIARLNQAEISQLDAGSKFGPAFAGERIPSLADVFKCLGKDPVYDLEIKNFNQPFNGLEHKVLELISRFGLEERVIITSFNPRAVRFFHQALPGVPAGLLLLSGGLGRLEEGLVSRWASPDLVGVYHRQLTSEFARRHSDQGVLVWGSANAADTLRAVDLGAAVVVADDPGLARHALEGR